jgi:hypothetical protein
MWRWSEQTGNFCRNAMARPGEIKLEHHTGGAPKFSIEWIKYRVGWSTF